MYYRLNLVADIAKRDGFFEPEDDNRYWEKKDVENGTWIFANGNTTHLSNPANHVPRLIALDQFEVRVTFRTDDIAPPAPERVKIIITIARHHDAGERIVASPFKNSDTNSVISIFGDGINPEAGLSNERNHNFRQSCGPINADFGSARGQFRFEFNVVARFQLANGTWIEFAIDPELDVDVNS